MAHFGTRQNQRARGTAGRFTPRTMENTFGLRVLICADCRACNPYSIGEPAPTTCHACGSERLT